MERVELYIYYPFWAFVGCSRVKLTMGYKYVCIAVKAALSGRHYQHFQDTMRCTKLHRGSSTRQHVDVVTSFFSELIRISGFDILQIPFMYWVHCTHLHPPGYGPGHTFWM